MHAQDSKFSFLSRFDGPGGRSEPRMYIGPGRREPRARTPDAGTAFMMRQTRSLPLLGVPAGFSDNLGNRLPAEKYCNLSCVYDADRSRGCLRSVKSDEERKRVPCHKSRRGWEPEDPPAPVARRPAGDVVIRKVGKRIIEDNANTKSNCDTVIWGRDLDGSAGLQTLTDKPLYESTSGHIPNIEKNPPYGVLPPVCKRTFGPEPPHEEWEGVKYTRPPELIHHQKNN